MNKHLSFSSIVASLMVMCLAFSSSAAAALSVQQSGGWLESVWLEFTGLTSVYHHYNAYVSANNGSTWTPLDGELVRSYGSYGRVDALGLTPGSYQLKVVPVNAAGTEQTADAVVSPALEVRAYDRNGFAHLRRSNVQEGVGAYNDNGTLKAGARVLYVTAANAKTVSLSMRTSNSSEVTLIGLQRILSAYEKGYEHRPLAIRIIGCLSLNNLDSIGSSEEGLQIKSKDYVALNLTVEGVGSDAAIKGFGILTRGVAFVEFRNFAILNCLDDCLSLNTKNSHIWIHNMDFFYGQPGSAADQVKGDGTVDLKDLTTNVTISYNHFFDSGKSSLCGMKSEADTCYVTYHHNWFDHSDSRHPRIRTISTHIYNNYYDGNSKYGVGVTSGASAFVEANYFRGCKYPMLASEQGTDAQGDGTFSGEAGGIIKAFGNYMTGHKGYRSYQSYGQSSDAYEVTNRADQVPASVTTVKNTNKAGESFADTYNNFDQMLLAHITPDPVAQVPTIVTDPVYGAGRCQKGDVAFSFADSEDANSSVIAALQTQVTSYSNTQLEHLIGLSSGPVFVQDTAKEVVEGSYECHFTGNKPSSALYTVTGTYKKDQPSVMVNGEEYSVAIKMESSTSITFTTTEDVNFYMVFGAAGQSAKVDGVVRRTASTNDITFFLPAGEHKIEKDGTSGSITSYLFYLNASPVTTDLDAVITPVGPACKVMRNGHIYIIREGRTYTIDGRVIE